MIGWSSVCYLCSTFVSTDWFRHCVGSSLSSAFVIYFYCFKQNEKLVIMAPALLFLTIACGLNAFFVERYQKQQFLEMK